MFQLLMLIARHGITGDWKAVCLGWREVGNKVIWRPLLGEYVRRLFSHAGQLGSILDSIDG